MPDALQSIASLVKHSNKFDHIPVGYVQKTAQKQPKVVLSAGMKIFENYKTQELQIRHKWNLTQICVTRYIPKHEGINDRADGCERN